MPAEIRNGFLLKYIRVIFKKKTVKKSLFFKKQLGFFRKTV